MSLRWYLRRAGAMEPTEVVRRTRDLIVQRRWRRRWGRAGDPGPGDAPQAVTFATPLPAGAAERVSGEARRRLLGGADGLLAGDWPVFGSWRHDLAPAPDWFGDPTTGARLPSEGYCFDLDIRRGASQRALKGVWELSRHHHTTVLATAYHLTGDDRYATGAAAQLRSWWAANPFLTGVHWTSAMELGIRLISWVWVRRLLDGWPEAGDLFEGNPVFLCQLRQHQEYLATFPSHGTSANNHLVAEAAGHFIASCAFPYFKQSPAWRTNAASVLESELERQTFPGGVHRELATAYHAFVLELGLVAAVEGEAAGHPLPDTTWDVLRRMVDALAAMLDVRLRPPRQGDDDEGCALLLDHPGFSPVASLLATGEQLFGRPDWWPKLPGDDDTRTSLLTSLVPGARDAPEVPDRRPEADPDRRPRLADAGMTVLRAGPGEDDELWCRLDHGPHGYLGIAAHAHADALSLELRVGGVDILAEPGTYCYQGDPEWRRYFRSTLAHNTLEVGGCDQSVPDGPFLWGRKAQSRLESLEGRDGDQVVEWRATHDGYHRLRPPATHRRIVRFHRYERLVEISDRLKTRGSPECRLAFHLGPDVACSLRGSEAVLAWAVNGTRRTAVLSLPSQLSWQRVCGAERPPLGWYSPGFGVRLRAVTLVGSGRVSEGMALRSALRVIPLTGAEGEAGP